MGKGNGLGVGHPGEPMNTLTKGDRHAVAQSIAYNISPGKGALKEDIHVTDAYATKTLDASASNPAMHQGGTAIVQPIAFSGQMSNPQTDVDMTQTLQAKNPMAVCLMDQGGSVMNVLQDGTVGTLRSETHGHEPVVMHPTFALDEYNQSGHKEVCYLLRTASGDGIPKVNVAQPIAFTTEQTPKFNENQALTLTKSEAKHNQSVLTEMAVRRLTPVECERLQGFPDGYTNIPWRKKEESPDGPRYKSLGNSMAVPVMAWIGKRIADAP
jgi:site-specific DNA-cytosine methylase